MSEAFCCRAHSPAVLVVAPAHEHALRIHAAAKHHERQRLAAIAAIVNKITQEDQVRVVPCKSELPVDEPLVHQQRQHAHNRLRAAVQVTHHPQLGVSLEAYFLDVVHVACGNAGVAVEAIERGSGCNVRGGGGGCTFQ